jgi:hypothetical protein
MARVQIPDHLRDEVERQARQLYGEDDTNRAVAQAIELWLTQVKEDSIKVAREINNRAYQELRADLEDKHWGEWVVIAQGKVQGISPNFNDVKDLALGAGHRIVLQIGEEPPPKIRRLGWRISWTPLKATQSS